VRHIKLSWFDAVNLKNTISLFDDSYTERNQADINSQQLIWLSYPGYPLDSFLSLRQAEGR
jgi:hypothetical protein